ncbi:tripartite tricarboxylate transporter TctB family protein [Bacillus piscicola]|uniref:tripartite tricarboxylate transporter TctB family protein n=1 Tax=Bacillus piscicola TaxID=1632684 RepID=UPI001F091346|nr:tripartite tricarboxylate transporter TctB family protein [Bacillus piscicola]
MSRRSVNPFLIVIFGLAALGLGYQLVTNPLGLITYLLVGTAVAVGIYFLFTRVIMKRMTMNQYRSQARPQSGARKSSTLNAKQRKIIKSHQTKNKPPKKRPSRAINKRRDDHNLTVIEGKKNRKKNRALF